MTQDNPATIVQEEPQIPKKRGIGEHIRAWLPTVIIILLILLLLILFLWPRVFKTIHSGEAGVLYLRFFGGTVIDYVYPEGFHVIAPWDDMYIYNTRVQTILHEFEVLTNRGLPIILKLAIRFRPEYEMIGVLHQQVGPDYVNTIIIPQIESVLRKNIGNLNPEDIYVNKEGIISKIIVRALEEAGQKFVIIDDIIIRSVELPEQVKQAIAEKLVEEQHAATYVFKLQKEKQEAERKRIEAQGIQDYQDIVSQTLSDQLIRWEGVRATLDLASSNNSKIVVIGAGKEGLPIILNER